MQVTAHYAFMQFINMKNLSTTSGVLGFKKDQGAFTRLLCLILGETELLFRWIWT